MLSFLFKVGKLVWKYGVRGVNAIKSWAQRNWQRVQDLLNGMTVNEVIDYIAGLLGF